MSFNLGTPIAAAIKELVKFDLLQVGETGAGKTWRTLDAVRFGPLYVFDFDGKIAGAVRENLPKYEGKVFYDNFNAKTFDEAYARLKAIKAEFDAGRKPFATVAIDTFTLLNEAAYISAMGKKLDQKGAKATFDEWGIIKNDLLNFMNLLKSLPCNTIINAHVALVENAEGKSVLGVEGQGGFARTLAKKMTDSHYLFFDQAKFKVRAAKSATLPANSNIDRKHLDPSGLVVTPGLGCFDDYAFKVKGN
jgi:hypothetical protein